MSESDELDINQIFLKAHKRAVKNAIEIAARTGTSLVSWENGKVKMIKPKVKYICVPINTPTKRKNIATRSVRLKK